jgi:hypothetical protein
MDRPDRTVDALALAPPVVELAFGGHLLAAHAGRTVARPAALLQAAL